MAKESSVILKAAEAEVEVVGLRNYWVMDLIGLLQVQVGRGGRWVSRPDCCVGVQMTRIAKRVKEAEERNRRVGVVIASAYSSDDFSVDQRWL